MSTGPTLASNSIASELNTDLLGYNIIQKKFPNPKFSFCSMDFFLYILSIRTMGYSIASAAKMLIYFCCLLIIIILNNRNKHLLSDGRYSIQGDDC